MFIDCEQQNTILNLSIDNLDNQNDAETEQLLNNIEQMLQTIQENPNSSVEAQANIQNQINTFNTQNKSNKIIILNDCMNSNIGSNKKLTSYNFIKNEPNNKSNSSIELGNSKQLGFKKISPKSSGDSSNMKPISRKELRPKQTITNEKKINDKPQIQLLKIMVRNHGM